MKYTPGPWRIKEDTMGCKTIVGNIQLDLESGLNDEIFFCESIGFTPGLANENEDLTNAKLISKAPEMLDLLKVIEKVYSKYSLANLDNSVIALEIDIPVKVARAISKLMADLC
uniref:Uncharacterized protein n=1 Tax=viral metagenome TaxID=1070528 RepID=A0A6M3LG33_9ZZZZ